jgi:hypothetical protein
LILLLLLALAGEVGAECLDDFGAVACKDFKVASQCNQQIGCKWKNGKCVGKAAPCSSFDTNREACEIQKGCRWPNKPPEQPSVTVSIEGTTVWFDATVIDPDDVEIVCVWDFGDGTTKEGRCKQKHTYNLGEAERRTFFVKVWGKDKSGAIGTEQIIPVTIKKPASETPNSKQQAWDLRMFMLLVAFSAGLSSMLLGIIFYIRARRVERAKMVEKLTTEKKSLENHLKKLKLEYYKRHINESEYKKQVLETERRLNAVQEELKKLKKKG